ncbi:LysM peptidoglycan-binding domain-containing protein [Barrientosiimonas humi]|uniref:LysM peptidoglycan-binding domain-containing protein n=1 Tax=Barrientosiimonas humi TaxID=999931 RepID=UPI00370D3E7E
MTTSTAPTTPSRAHRLRAAGAGLLLAVALLTAAWLTGSATWRELERLRAAPLLRVDDVVPLVALVVLLAGLLWLALLVTVCSLELARAVRPSHPAVVDRRTPRLSPALATRITGLLLAATAFGSLGGTTAATAASAPTVSISAGSTAPSPDLLAPRSAPAPDFAKGEAGERSQPSPDLAPGDQRPAATARECAPPAAPEPGWVGSGPRLQPSSTLDRAGLLGRCAPASGEIVVHRGDTLWSIVERDLGPTATAREIAEAWPRWFAANREAIGADPDLLLPGTVLLRPSQEAVS